MTPLNHRLTTLRQTISDVCNRSGRKPTEITLLAVSKTRSCADIRELQQLGIHDFGENYVQEAREKITELKPLPITWHFIGPLQSNKTADVAELFDWVHSIDRARIAQRLDRQRPAELEPMQVCIQVNVSNEIQKSGVSVADTGALATSIASCARLKLRGLMCIAEQTDDQDRLAQQFHQVAQLADDLRQQGHSIDTLSMGMSSDLDVAIDCGSTLLRIGTALFGPRDTASSGQDRDSGTRRP